jgi:hypothetical protein
VKVEGGNHPFKRVVTVLRILTGILDNTTQKTLFFSIILSAKMALASTQK